MAGKRLKQPLEDRNLSRGTKLMHLQPLGPRTKDREEGQKRSDSDSAADKEMLAGQVLERELAVRYCRREYAAWLEFGMDEVRSATRVRGSADDNFVT